MKLSKKIIEWYHSNGRKLPWRGIKDPYRIWISEIILQQTRIQQGWDYYVRFTERFKTVEELAHADLDDVLKRWEGLGYYSRARNLHFTAQYIHEHFSGKFPQTAEELIKLKGIGPYTSRAISSFAFGEKTGVLDGNVFRWVSRLLADPSPIDQTSTRKKFQETLDFWIQKVNPADFNHAIMDLGSLVCTPTNPKCDLCPVNEDCIAHQRGTQLQFPIKLKKNKRTIRYFHFFLYSDSEGKIKIQQRPQSGLWGGLWEIPNEEVKKKSWDEQIPAGEFLFLGKLKHIFTHFDMMIKVYSSKVLPETNSGVKEQFIDKDKICKFAFSKGVLKIFDAFLEKIA